MTAPHPDTTRVNLDDCPICDAPLTNGIHPEPAWRTGDPRPPTPRRQRGERSDDHTDRLARWQDHVDPHRLCTIGLDGPTRAAYIAWHERQADQLEAIVADTAAVADELGLPLRPPSSLTLAQIAHHRAVAKRLADGEADDLAAENARLARTQRALDPRRTRS